ncbi:BQ2448_7864 [Microbotryum intermedium]|uniref:Nuclear pore complex protein Nup85 n=1 Tax=Microbotryum intermedium TaxID=269621 RepID=A0A238FNS7_9BASI|nr:BQ2448_7864 [Microbotryum intermedium]
MTTPRVHLQPPAPAHTTLQPAWNPLSPNQLVLVPTPQSTSRTATTSTQQQQGQQLLYYASSQGASTSTSKGSALSSYSRDFVVSTWTLFASLQKIAKQEEQNQALKGVKSGFGSDELGVPTPETIKYYNRISKLYRGAVVNEWNKIQNGSTTSPSIQPHELALLHSTLSLTEILYLPQDGHGQGVVGEELLHWLNTLDPSPSKEQGEALADLARPWEREDDFWEYLYKCILRAHLVSAQALLNLLASHHPSAWVQRVASHAIDLIASFPRSTKHESEMGFEKAFRNWRANATRVAARFQSGVEDDHELGEDGEERDRWVTGFEVVFGLLKGDQEVVLKRCEDWRERVCTWGVWVDPRFKRVEVDQVLGSEKDFAKDEEQGGEGFRDTEEEVQYALFKGDVGKALKVIHRVSGWLAAHLSDLLDKVGVVQPPPLRGSKALGRDRDEFETRLRDWFVMRYAEELWETDVGLWRVVVEYFGSGCGEEGRVRMGKVLRGVDIFGEGGEGEGEKEQGEREGQERLVEEVLATAAEHGLEEDVVAICKTYSEHLISLSRYGAALAFCVRSGDLKRVSRIADRILDEYLTNGQDAFVRCVDEIPVSLLRPSKGRRGKGSARAGATSGDGDDHEVMSDEEMAEDDSDLDTIQQDDIDEDNEDQPSLAPFSTRLAFLARYRDFFALYAKGERRQAAKLLCLLLSSNVAPKRIWAVLLVDSVGLLVDESEATPLVDTEECYELMRCLEEITSPILAGDGDFEDVYGHLDALGKLMNGGRAAENGDERTRKELGRRGMKQLDVVRGALASCLARGVCLV